MLSQDISVILPELMLAIFAMVALMAGAYGQGDKWSGPITWLTALFLAILGAVDGLTGGTHTAFNGTFIDDPFARFAKVIILFGAAIILLLSDGYMRKHKIMRFEYPVLIALATLGMMVMVSAGDLMVLYMGLELQSLALYVIASIRRDSLRSTEAGLKYFVLGALSSGLLLYGASLVYGYTGATKFESIAAVAEHETSIGLLFGLVFLCAGLAFKISAVPFHMWTPDVYEGAPTPVTAFFATAPKAAAAALFARVLYDGFGGAAHDWGQILAFLAIASMFLGSVAAIGQSNIKRLMAYSSIAHMGFALVGLAAGTPDGATSLLIYVAIYVTMNVGVFAFILTMERDGKPVTQISDLAGLSGTRPAAAIAMLVLFFSLAGIPPLVGFWAKYYSFSAAVEAGMIPLAAAGAVASVIGAFYYLRIVKIMFFDEVGQGLTGPMPLAHGVTLAVSALVIGLGGMPLINLFGVPEAAAVAAASLIH
ncbi:NADH-quinone oxidoreductase subunit NuoN [Albimonas pacifica]|uniref:NADH-quinone oxidoreductase subunit N n=1 Tax=Albimonas pacifica TaxID=1114924 RepID=A0A1I3KPW2_9RHOB|nr:NADH-quinone oxidoreductase subunit NuoN [Albimonas pacifica]SFI74552.1 NADH dehydrogenase subunit N [Albimonas pacifica]